MQVPEAPAGQPASHPAITTRDGWKLDSPGFSGLEVAGQLGSWLLRALWGLLGGEPGWEICAGGTDILNPKRFSIVKFTWLAWSASPGLTKTC